MPLLASDEKTMATIPKTMPTQPVTIESDSQNQARDGEGPIVLPAGHGDVRSRGSKTAPQNRHLADPRP